jgi:hypothetical protein
MKVLTRKIGGRVTNNVLWLTTRLKCWLIELLYVWEM